MTHHFHAPDPDGDGVSNLLEPLVTTPLSSMS
jgi:hypothetical protein